MNNEQQCKANVAQSELILHVVKSVVFVHVLIAIVLVKLRHHTEKQLHPLRGNIYLRRNAFSKGKGKNI